MGSTWVGLRAGESPLDKVREDLAGMEVVAEGTGAGSGDWSRVHYAAVRRDGNVSCYVTLYAKQDGGVVYKSIHESSLPYYFTAPKNVMDALTPTDDESSNEWRSKVREEGDKNYGPSRLADGMRINFPNTYWGKANTFVARKVGRRWVFEDVYTGSRYRLGGWTREQWKQA